jgi:hypothetical protein
MHTRAGHLVGAAGICSERAWNTGAEPRPSELSATVEASAWRELHAARERLAALTARRQRLAEQLAAAAAEEDAERRTVKALEGIVGDGEDGNHQGHAPAGARIAGRQLRMMIARVALRGGHAGTARHWRYWLGWLRDAGFEPAGKRPDATFLTQLSRSPLVCRDRPEGVYVLDVGRFEATYRRLRVLEEQLRVMPSAEQLSMLGDVRARRQELQREIERCERDLEEAWVVLCEELPVEVPQEIRASAEATSDWWLARTSAAGAQRS